MTEENKKMPENPEPELNEFYAVLSGYIDFCMQRPKTRLSDKEKEGLDAKQIEEKENTLRDELQRHEEYRKKYQNTYDAMCEEIIRNGIPYLMLYVKALEKLYEDRPDRKRDVKAVLVQGKSLNLFRAARASIIDLYPILRIVNTTFPVDDYSELSLSPEAAMYGSEVDKTQNGSTKKAPMKKEEYQAMLEMFLQVKDYKRFGEWLMAILVFSPEKLINAYHDSYEIDRKALKEWAYSQIYSNENYRRSVIDVLLKNRMLEKLLEAYITKPMLQKKQTELEKEIERLNEDIKRESAVHEERRKKQYEIIQHREVENAELRDRIKDYDRYRQQLTDYKEKYQVQISINERIARENDRRIRIMEEEHNSIQEELETAEARFNQMQEEYLALQSDYSLKNIELQKLIDMAEKKEEIARINMMRELVNGINEQFFYLTMFYLELQDTGKLDTESIELYADTLRNIDDVLADLGIQKIGAIDEDVSYDASIHVSTDAMLSNGDKVVIRGYGWKIGDEVYIKAPVEKGEQ